MTHRIRRAIANGLREMAAWFYPDISVNVRVTGADVALLHIKRIQRDLERVNDRASRSLS